MIKFFRKIRQKLLAENKLSKYLLYAVGEIVLVVIGILIALSINNWNQTNSEKKIAENYIESLIIELNSDLNYYKSHKLRNMSQITQINDIQNALNSIGVNNSKEDFILKLMDVMEPFPFSPKTATYTDLVTSGNMGLIQPETIRQRIISHYNLVDQMTLHVNREIDYNWNHLHPFFNENGYFEWRNNPKISVDSTIIKKRKHFPIFELEKSSLEFKAVENNLYFRQLMLTTRSGNLDELMTSTQELIDVLNKK
ncbi:DUF6090 family protein [Robiginitalea biformata]|uniref:Uncharacterized protein n=1 Tax=Robiginitalea biformata (strain ATCC BAA-864 / DSM 15991 / KCTC 12146 / HTCC2501) TaxID=313596 RepID=A4CN35_ROBBH|nr:DUF6090 family protein [Robiginitalea biformata]EAR15077.1 hypothetical protein RB2501_12142 [Robiginitalea biformata HTCC2501]